MSDRPTRSEIFGLCVIRKRVSASSDKIDAVRNYPTPRNVKDVRAFLGLASFYRRLVEKFADSETAYKTNPEGTRIPLGP